MVTRTLESKLAELATYYPVVVVTGPRQSGKTTLCQMAFPTPGRFILTGSEHFGLSPSISQSLAGRCGLLTLLPQAFKSCKSFPKLHFYDSGLLCYLLGIREPEQLRLHPLRGAVFESWAVSEIYKAYLHGGLWANFFHYREARGLEIDLLIEKGQELAAVDVKSGATVNEDFFKNLKRFAERIQEREGTQLHKYVVYGGQMSQKRIQAHVLSWKDIGETMLWD